MISQQDQEIKIVMIIRITAGMGSTLNRPENGRI
jgi:hypothetical protein